MLYSNAPNDELYHYGVLGMKWGVHRSDKKSKSVTRCHNSSELLNYMKKNIKYSDFTKLKKPEEVIRTKSGSCHDQTFLELNELAAMGYKPKAMFLIEYNSKTGQGGMTHSFAYYKKNGKINWFENAWQGHEGIHQYNSINDMKLSILEMHNNKKFGDVSQYENLEICNFGNHNPGETLQQFVNNALDSEKIEHSNAPNDELYHYGVLGMKWGHRKFVPYSKHYFFRTKGEKVADKYEKKANSYFVKSILPQNTSQKNVYYKNLYNTYHAAARVADKGIHNKDDRKTVNQKKQSINAQIKKLKKINKNHYKDSMIGEKFAKSQFDLYYSKLNADSGLMKSAMDFISIDPVTKQTVKEIIEDAK